MKSMRKVHERESKSAKKVRLVRPQRRPRLRSPELSDTHVYAPYIRALLGENSEGGERERARGKSESSPRESERERARKTRFVLSAPTHHTHRGYIPHTHVPDRLTHPTTKVIGCSDNRAIQGFKIIILKTGVDSSLLLAGGYKAFTEGWPC